MRKNLMTLILGLLFVFFGTFAVKADSLSDNSLNTKNKSEFSIKYRSELVTSFNKNISKLKKVCEVSYCDYMIGQAANAFDQMIAACDYNEGSSACADAQTMVTLIAALTIHYCSLNAHLIRKEDFVQELAKLNHLTAKKAVVQAKVLLAST